jgi:hypothetical protein
VQATKSEIDAANWAVVLKATDGTTEKGDLAKSDGFNQIRVGDQIVISLTQEVAISLTQDTTDCDCAEFRTSFADWRQS